MAGLLVAINPAPYAHTAKPKPLISAILIVDLYISEPLLLIMSAYVAPASFLPITSDLRPGAIALGTVSTISTICVSLLLLNLFIVAIISRRSGNTDDRIFIRTHIGALVVCLLLSDLIQGICGMITLIWVRNGRVSTGTLCMAQAVMLHIGDVGTAFWNTVIAGHTFWTVVLGKRSSTLGIACVIAAGWTTCFIITMLGPFAIQTKENGPFYAIAGVWCFITSNYQTPRIILHYAPMLISASIITILYIHVALVLFGILTIDGGAWRLQAPTRKRNIRDFFGQFSWGRLHRPSGATTDQSIDVSTGVSDGSLDRGRKSKPRSAGKKSTPGMSVYDHGASSRPARLKKLAVKMLWYPSVYLVLILPVTISRIDPSIKIDLDVLLGFTCMLLFMGTANTIIYICTRHLGQVPWSRSTSRSRSRGDRGQAGTVSHAGISMQIQVERYTTQPVRDDQSIDLARKKSTASGLTDSSSIASIPPVVTSGGGDDFTRGYRESKVGFDFTGGKPTRHVLPTNSQGPNAAVGAPEHLLPYMEYQEHHSQHPLSPPRPPVRHQEQEQPEETHPGRHPYSLA